MSTQTSANAGPKIRSNFSRIKELLPDLTALSQWVAYHLGNPDTKGKRTKIPKCVDSTGTLKNASTTNPDNWMTFGQAAACAQKYGLAGVGFVFTKDDPFVGVDIDHCVDENGNLVDEAAALVQELSSYTEITPSGAGLHIICRGNIPGGLKYGKFEFYQDGRYFTMTGHHWAGAPTPIADRTEELQAIHARFTTARDQEREAARPKEQTRSANSRPSSYGGTSVAERARRYIQKLPPAISGQGGHNATFRCACVLIQGFSLSIDEARSLLMEWNGTHCSPAWSDRELDHKLRQASTHSGSKPAGYLLTNDYFDQPWDSACAGDKFLEASVPLKIGMLARPRGHKYKGRIVSIDDEDAAVFYRGRSTTVWYRLCDLLPDDPSLCRQKRTDKTDKSNSSEPFGTFGTSQTCEDKNSQEMKDPDNGAFGTFGTNTPQDNSDIQWEDPVPFPDGLKPVMPLPAEMIPVPFRDWLVDISQRMQCPLEFPAIGALVAASSIIGTQVNIRPKRFDNWTVTPNLWGAGVGDPGLLKTPAMNESLKPIYRLIHEAGEEFELSTKEFEFQKALNEAEKSSLRKQLDRAVKSKNTEEIDSIRKQMLSDSLISPLERRYIVNDSSIEKLGELLNENPRGLLIHRDELTAWLKTLDRDGHEADRGFYLEGWTGNQPFVYDRIGRGTVRIKAVTLSILGTIQPGPLAAYLRGALSGAEEADGLLQRFQLLVYPNISPAWENIDRWPDKDSKNRAFNVFKKLDTLDLWKLSPTQDPDQGEHNSPPFLRFDDEAQIFFDEWRSELEHELRSNPSDYHPAVIAHLAKYRSLLPSLALIFHLINFVDDQAQGSAVGLIATQRAAAWCELLKKHALRVYGMATNGDIDRATTILKNIARGVIKDGFTARDIRRHHWSGLSTPKDVADVLQTLEDFNYLKSVELKTGGRPTSIYFINPKILKAGEQ